MTVLMIQRPQMGPLRASSLSRTVVGAAFLLATAGQANAASNSDFCAKDPYADPQNDLCNPLRYVPTQWASILSMCLYFVVSAALTYRLWRHGKKWMLALIIGGFCEGIGLMFRIPFRANLHSSGLYILLYLFTVLSPCAFLAVDYIILGRLSAHLDGHRHLKPFSPRFLTRIFVGSDIVTFCIQAAGGGLSTSQNPASRKAGGNIFLAGLALQLVSFAGFTGLYVAFGWRMRKNDPEVWNKPGWKPLYWALGWTCIGFLTRSVYRTIELSEGYTGHLATTEWYFYVFDILPLWLGISAYIFFWPLIYINDETHVAPRDVPELKADETVGSGGSSAAGEDIALSDTTPKAVEAGVERGRPVMA